MSSTYKKLISLMAYDAALTERTDDYYLRAKTVGSLSLQDLAREYAAARQANPAFCREAIFAARERFWRRYVRHHDVGYDLEF